MNIDFVVNDYLLAWYVLFKPSFCEEVQELKEKLWNNYQKQYIAMQKDNIEILKYTKDFIPDDDTIYNLIFDTELFQELKKETEKYRQKLLEAWDKNKKAINEELKTLARIDIKSYTILAVSPKLDIIEYIKSNPKKNIAWGKKEAEVNYLESLMHILYTIVKYEIGDFQKENSEIVTAILDLLVTNELYTRITGISKYSLGYRKLRLLRRQLYPYWLMYLGCDKEELVSYMMRDQIAFDIDKYTIERGLRKVNIYDFIDFCCRNQKYIIRLDDLNIV